VCPWACRPDKGGKLGRRSALSQRLSAQLAKGQISSSKPSSYYFEYGPTLPRVQAASDDILRPPSPDTTEIAGRYFPSRAYPREPLGEPEPVQIRNKKIKIRLNWLTRMWARSNECSPLAFGANFGSLLRALQWGRVSCSLRDGVSKCLIRCSASTMPRSLARRYHDNA